MAKFRSKGNTTIGDQEVADGATVEAYVVTPEEKTLQASIGSGVEHLTTGDALVTLGKAQHVVRAAAFNAQFEPEGKAKAKKPDQEAAKK